MKVYILLLYTMHEGFENAGVFSSWEKAEEFQAEEEKKDSFNGTQWYDIEEHEIIL